MEEIAGSEFHEANLVVHAFLGFDEVAADVGEGRGTFGGNAIGGEFLEEIAEDMVDINLREEIAGGSGEFGGEIALAAVGRLGGIGGLNGFQVGEKDIGAHLVALGAGTEGAAGRLGYLRFRSFRMVGASTSQRAASLLAAC